MKKNLLMVVFIATTFLANAVGVGTYYFGSGAATGNLTASSFTLNNLATGNVATDYYSFSYPGTDGAGLASSIYATAMPDFVFSFTNTSTKSDFFRIYDAYFYTAGKGVILTISNVTVGDSIILTTKAKGSTADAWTITSGATTSSTLTNDNATWYTIRLKATQATIILKETAAGFDISKIEVKAPEIVSAVNTINTNKKVVDVQHYDILGKKINENAKGMVIQKVTYDDGTVGTVKSYIKDK